MITCKVCLHDDTEAIEKIGQQALSGDLSWRAAEHETTIYGISRQSLKNHMETHYTKVVEASFDAELQAIEAEFEGEVRQTVVDLFQMTKTAVPEKKVLYLSMIHNLRGLKYTKPSQQHLILAQKTIQDEESHDIFIQFGRAFFTEVTAPKQPVLDIVGVEVPALTEASFAEGGDS